MCLASTEPGGPRRCSGDTRGGYQKSASTVDYLEHRHAWIRAQLAGLAAADRYRAASELPTPQRDEVLAGFTPEEIDALAQTRRDAIRPAVDAAFAATPTPALTGTARDTSINQWGDIPIHRPSGIDTVRGQFLDANTAVFRQANRGDYAIAYRDGAAYRIIATSYNFKAAITKANRIPVLTDLAPPPGGIDDLQQQQVHRAKADVAMQLATEAANGRLTTPHQQAEFLEEQLARARDEIVDAAGVTPLHAEILDATTRHRDQLRRAAAHAVGQSARAHAITAGHDDPEHAYRQAYRAALGTPTRGGAHIPHFDHHTLPAPGISLKTHTLLQHSGIRVYGAGTADDYTVFARRGGDLDAWGFNTHGLYARNGTTDYRKLTATHGRFIEQVLTADERAALRTYTSGRHVGAGAYIQINDTFTGRTAIPAPAVETTCTHLRSAFAKFARYNTTRTPITVVRGTHIPTGWSGTCSDYLATAFPAGAKVELGQVASASTRTSAASRFANRGGDSYLMVIQTRDGLPVKSISDNAAEDEVIIPPGTPLRCVRVDHNGINHRPTVYLVAEDLAAEAEAASVRAAAS